MKRLLIIYCTVLFTCYQTQAQISRKLESFREKVLPLYSVYFNKAELSENRYLCLSATDKYAGLSAVEKKPIMVYITSEWQESLVLVQYGSKRELWGLSAETGSTQLIDEWDLNSPQLYKKPQLKMVSHPWFFYGGFQFGGDNQHNLHFSLNTRLGFFLLKNRWDFATTYSAGVSGNTSNENSSTAWGNFGLMSRVYFPLKKYPLSPNIGGEMTVGRFDGETSFNGSIVLGINWYIGFGSVNIGLRFGKEISSMGGLTVMPSPKHHK